jgi:hypothetical protein
MARTFPKTVPTPNSAALDRARAWYDRYVRPIVASQTPPPEPPPEEEEEE